MKKLFFFFFFYLICTIIIGQQHDSTDIMYVSSLPTQIVKMSDEEINNNINTGIDGLSSFRHLHYYGYKKDSLKIYYQTFLAEGHKDSLEDKMNQSVKRLLEFEHNSKAVDSAFTIKPSDIKYSIIILHRHTGYGTFYFTSDYDKNSRYIMGFTRLKNDNY